MRIINHAKVKTLISFQVCDDRGMRLNNQLSFSCKFYVATLGVIVLSVRFCKVTVANSLSASLHVYLKCGSFVKKGRTGVLTARLVEQVTHALEAKSSAAAWA